MTFFWADFSPQTELRHAQAMVAAAKAAGVEHVVWSTLENTRDFIPLDDDRMPTLQGKYKVPHFDGKSDADGVFRDAGVPRRICGRPSTGRISSTSVLSRREMRMAC